MGCLPWVGKGIPVSFFKSPLPPFHKRLSFPFHGISVVIFLITPQLPSSFWSLGKRPFHPPLCFFFEVFHARYPFNFLCFFDSRTGGVALSLLPCLPLLPSPPGIFLKVETAIFLAFCPLTLPVSPPSFLGLSVRSRFSLLAFTNSLSFFAPDRLHLSRPFSCLIIPFSPSPQSLYPAPCHRSFTLLTHPFFPINLRVVFLCRCP